MRDLYNLLNSRILIGRDPATSGLLVAVFKNHRRAVDVLATQSAIPQCVSRLILEGNSAKGHCMISIDGSGNMRLKNLKVSNRTYVDDLECDSRLLHPYSHISLGISKYPVNLDEILNAADRLAVGLSAPGQSKIDISHLESLWTQYDEARRAIRKRVQTLNIVASSSGVFSLASILLMRLGDDSRDLEFMGPMMLAFSIAALLIAMISVFLRLTDKTEDRLKELDNWFMHSYNCPHCGGFLGYQPFFLVKKSGGHRCGVKW